MEKMASKSREFLFYGRVNIQSGTFHDIITTAV